MLMFRPPRKKPVPETVEEPVEEPGEDLVDEVVAELAEVIVLQPGDEEAIRAELAKKA